MPFMLVLFVGLDTQAAPDTSATCTEDQKIHKSFPSGATWDLCIDVRKEEGIVLSQVYYQAPGQTARRILGEISLSQLETVQDENLGQPDYLMTQHGLGGDNLLTLQAQDCPGGSIRAIGGRNVLCRRSQGAGYQYKYETQRQGEYFDLISHSYVSPRTYTLRWRLYENGIIEPALGTSGRLSERDAGTTGSTSELTMGFTDHLGWRVDFDLGSDPDDDVVEEITSTPTGDRLRKDIDITRISHETGRLLDPEVKRFWRVRDGDNYNPAGIIPSYELVPLGYNDSRNDVRGQLWLQNDVYFTLYKPCERHMAHNSAASCEGNGNAVRFTQSPESIDHADIVVWYKQSYHHLPRSEDTHKINTVWNKFQLLPRDWHPQNPF